MPRQRLRDKIKQLHPGTQPWQRLFLEYWLEGRDRLVAAEKVHRTWAEIEASMKTDEAFTRAAADVTSEILVAVEDGLVRDALDGHGPSKSKLLEAYHPRYVKRVQVDQNVTINGSLTVTPADTADARGRWKQLYAKLANRALPASPMEDVVDAVVEEGSDVAAANVS